MCMGSVTHYQIQIFGIKHAHEQPSTCIHRQASTQKISSPITNQWLANTNQWLRLRLELRLRLRLELGLGLGLK